ncbi:MAG TPA: hypothetical protein VEJ87_17000 [Acidimicrobiales bacterium]|nr:hypothetical protein [Acidimicrobiales bacterium]
MVRFHKVGVTVAACVVATSVLLAVAGSTPAFAGGQRAKGTVNCFGSGTIEFSPAWSDSGKGTVTAAVSETTQLFSCVGGDPEPFLVTVSGKLSFANGTCTSSASSSVAVTGKLKFSWGGMPPGFDPTSTGKLLFGYYVKSSGTLEGPISVKGSYPTRSAFASFDTWTLTGNCTAGISSAAFASSTLSAV